MKMKPLFLTLAIAISVLAAAEKRDTPKQRTPAKKAETKVPETTVPPDAKEIAPYTYSYTDPKGKKWLYYLTPFGLTKVEDRPVSADSAGPAKPVDLATAVEDGDIVRFERPTPFGPYRWQKKNSELSLAEQEILERGKQKNAVAKQGKE